MDHFFQTQQLTVGYNGKPLVRDITISLPKGRILTLIGPNGSGKSTILKTIIKQLKSLGGVVSLGGQSTDAMKERDLARQISVLLTQRMKTERMTCQDVVETGRYPYTGSLGILSQQDRAVVRTSMELTHVTELADLDFMKISDGQRQRVLLARAIAQEPEVLVLDEPTSFLDVRYKLELLDLLRQLTRRNSMAVILSLHELDLAQRISDDVLCVRGETVSHYGPAEEIFQKELIHQLYDLNTGSYDPLFGSVELKGPQGEPRVFVIAGGGTGIPVFRLLQKQGIPFSSGVLHENDVDYQVSKALATRTITENAFQPIGSQTFRQAVDTMVRCEKVICCLKDFGLTNARNRDLLTEAQSRNIPIEYH